jgi:hypothetical protein
VRGGLICQNRGPRSSAGLAAAGGIALAFRKVWLNHALPKSAAVANCVLMLKLCKVSSLGGPQLLRC